MITGWKLISREDTRFYQLEASGAIMACSTRIGDAAFLKHFKPIFQKQVHSAIINDVDENAPTSGDGMISGLQDVCLGIKVADCLPVFIFNDRKICVIHCGWRGIAGGIAVTAKEMMIDYQYALGASIGPCCYEIRSDVANAFAAHAPGAVTKMGDRTFLDLKTAVINILGREKLIADLAMCTKCRNDIFFSCRAGDGENRNYAAMVRK